MRIVKWQMKPRYNSTGSIFSMHDDNSARRRKHAGGSMSTSQYVKLIQSQLSRMIQVHTGGSIKHVRSSTDCMECCTIDALTGLESGYDKKCIISMESCQEL
jgi:hypothetical protein